MNNMLELKGRRFVQAAKKPGSNGASMNSTCDKDSPNGKDSKTFQTLPTIHNIEIFKKREERNSNHSKANEPENIEHGNTDCLQ